MRVRALAAATAVALLLSACSSANTAAPVSDQPTAVTTASAEPTPSVVPSETASAEPTLADELKSGAATLTHLPANFAAQESPLDGYIAQFTASSADGGVIMVDLIDLTSSAWAGSGDAAAIAKMGYDNLAAAGDAVAGAVAPEPFTAAAGDAVHFYLPVTPATAFGTEAYMIDTDGSVVIAVSALHFDGFDEALSTEAAEIAAEIAVAEG